jgi:integrase
VAKHAEVRVHGPYKHHNKYRVILARGRRSREVVTFETEAEAVTYRDAAVAQLKGLTVSQAITEYLDDVARDIKPASRATKEFRLKALHPSVNARVDDMRRRDCAVAYLKRSEQVKADTHRNELQEAKAFGEWLLKRGLHKMNPWANVEPTGRRRQGKEQLRIDEARIFSERAFELAEAGDASAAAVLVALLMGMRSSEVLDRVVRDLDDGGRILWIPDSKTAAGRRHLEVPPVLRSLLLSLVKGRPGMAPLIERKQRKKEILLRGERGTRAWLLYHTRRICKLAGVPSICVHSLRGLHATLATEAGATSHLVASALGHAGPAVTERHYTRAEATRNAMQERAMRVLVGGKS